MANFMSSLQTSFLVEMDSIAKQFLKERQEQNVPITEETLRSYANQDSEVIGLECADKASEFVIKRALQLYDGMNKQ